MKRETGRTIYLWIVTICGFAIFAHSSWSLPLDNLDLRFAVLASFTILVGSRITVPIPLAYGRISISDTLIFLALVFFGAESAILLASVEALVSSSFFSKRYLVSAFNAATLGISTFITANTVILIFGDIVRLRSEYSVKLIGALCVMALIQFAINSILSSISLALKNYPSVWAAWHANFMWALPSYFACALGAGLVAFAIDEAGTFAFVVVAPIIGVIYFTYRTYLTNIAAASAQAEQAKQHVVELNHHLSEQERISKALAESEAHFRTAFDYAVIGMALVSPSGIWLRVNRSLCDLLGYSETELLGSSFQAITHRDDLGRDLAESYRMLAGEIPSFQLEKRFIHKLGSEVWTAASASLVRDADGQPLHFILQIQDVTERKRAESAIQTLSLVDELTGLYNRRGFMTFAQQHLSSLHRSDKQLVVVYADLDGLKEINDSFGHNEGDRALCKTAELFRETFRASDVIGRLGGDEFTVLATVDPENGVQGLVARLRKKFCDYNQLRAAPYELAISLGVAVIEPGDYQSIEDLLATADKEMYDEKRTRKRDRQLLNQSLATTDVAVA